MRAEEVAALVARLRDEERYVDACDEAADALERLTRERDEAQSACADMATQGHHDAAEITRLTRERDEARKHEAEEIQNAFDAEQYADGKNQELWALRAEVETWKRRAGELRTLANTPSEIRAEAEVERLTRDDPWCQPDGMQCRARAEVERRGELLNRWTLTRLDGGSAHVKLHTETLSALAEEDE